MSPTPLPVAKLATIACINLMNTASYLMTMPFVAFMILHYFPDITPEQVGYYSGLLEGTFHVGAFGGALFWGFFADKYGRRPALLLGLLGTVLCTVWFGASPDFVTALVARFAWGALNGNVGVAKTALSELCDDTNSARAFSFIGLNTGFGRIVGPVLGGLLSEPAKKYPAVFAGYPLLVTYPFLLPCLVAAAMTMACFFATYFLLEETMHLSVAEAKAHKIAAAADRKGTLAGRARRVRVAGKAPAQKAHPRGEEASEEEEDEDDNDEEVRLVDSGRDASSASGSVGSEAAVVVVHGTPSKNVEGRGGSGASVAHPPSRHDSRAPAESTLAGMLRLARDPPVATACALYSALGMVGLVSNELAPLYVLNDSAHGGFGWDSAKIGYVGLASGPFLVIFQAFMYDRVVGRYGMLGVLRASLAGFSLLLALTPLQSLALSLSPLAQDAVLYTHSVLINLFRVTAFVCVFVIVANSALPEDRGRVNGLGQAAVSLVRAIGPPIGTAAFAASVSPGATALGWPFNFHAVWYGLALLSLGTLALTYELPPWASGKRPPSAR